MTLRYDSGQASYVLVGDLDSKNNFVKNFIGSENIKSFNLFSYQETLKIPQVREIKKLLSRSAVSGKRLFIVHEATLEAQNALLKTLEELPEDTTFIFMDDSNLLPTIISRSRVLNFERKDVIEVDESLANKLSKFINGKPDLVSILLFLDSLFSQTQDIDFPELILGLRKILFDSIEKKDIERSDLCLRLLKALQHYSPLVVSNNLNKRLVAEKILLTNVL